MEPNVEIVVNEVRRKRAITVRWSPEYLLGRFVILLGVSQMPVGREALIRALIQLENPQLLITSAKIKGYALNDAIFPEYLLQTLSYPLPVSTPRYDQALGLGIAKCLLSVIRETNYVRFALTSRGQELYDRLIAVDSGQKERIRLALMVTD